MTKPNSDGATGPQSDAFATRLRKSTAKLSSRSFLLVIIIVASAVIGSWFPQISAPLRFLFSSKTEVVQPAEQQSAEGLVKLTLEQIEAAKIETAPAGPGTLTKRLVAPASMTPDPDRIGRVAAKVAGTIAELRKRLGDNVALNEVIAVVDSREVADAKSGYLAAAVQYDLQNQLFLREKGLFEKKITAEQLFLKAKTSFAEAKLRLDLARQKLAALDLSESEITDLPSQPISSLRRKEIRAPIAGRVIERLVSLGQPVGGEGQAKELYVLSDLSVVQADISVPISDLAAIREGQLVLVKTPDERVFEGKVVVVNAIITQETRSGHVIASFGNPDFALHPGVLLNAEIALARTPVKVRIPRAAMQMIDNEPTVFVRAPNGFVKRKIVIGATDDVSAEVTAGLSPGEAIAVSNTFVLKAEAAKSNIPEE
ncbi:efflux RND transporter periplasmic adaptor subunit [Methylocystis rosea]|uniref:Efflux RND transporter periplasmic adaptor subunit n=1 Tax=Methylocystis rosea TaxID=173366 RepID=A0A3G8MA66_9HYPH|nr:efflux RND transporter periplasmic adaptor subunit [Methylocystis rosea]AZG78883.1 efflux RND transporter periplasmic adaptor subunit [Methylocystis rosea]